MANIYDPTVEFTSPTTELQAVNSMLATIGEDAVETLEEPTFGDAQVAFTLLRNITRELQSRGWFWNTEEDVVLTPNSTGELEAPPNTMRLWMTGTSEGLNAVLRGSRIYDRENKTYQWADQVTVSYVALLPFIEMPEAGRRYVALRAARIFEARHLGNQLLAQHATQDEEAAYNNLIDDEVSTADPNALRDSWSVYRVISNRRGAWLR